MLILSTNRQQGQPRKFLSLVLRIEATKFIGGRGGVRVERRGTGQVFDRSRPVTENGLSHEILLNVNMPFLEDKKIRGICLTRQGLRVYPSRLDERTDPRSKPYYWIGGDAPTGVPERGTDVGALGRRVCLCHPAATGPDCLPDLHGPEHLAMECGPL